MESQHWIPTVTSNGRHLDIYSSMVSDGIVFVNAGINQRVAGLVVSALIHICKDSKQQEAKLYINAGGGDITSALSVVDMMEFFKSRAFTIHTMGLGEVGVGSALILAAGTKGCRKLAHNSQVSLYLGGNALEVNNALSSQAKVTQAERLRGLCIDMLARFSTEDVEGFRIRTNTETFLSAPEAQSLGLIDELA